MFWTAMSAILHRDMTVDLQTASDDTDERSLPEITSIIIGRRLQKLNGLRAHLRRSCLGLGAASASKAMVFADMAEGTSTIDSPAAGLNAQQTFVMGTNPFTFPRPMAKHQFGAEVPLLSLLGSIDQDRHTDDVGNRIGGTKPLTAAGKRAPWMRPMPSRRK
jgi:hypothetical protein